MDDFESRVAQLLTDYDQRLEAKRQEQQREEVDAQRFLGAFATVERDVLRPVLEKTEALLERRGHRCVMSTQTPSREAEAEVRLSVYPRGYRREEFTDDTTPHIRFIAHPVLGLVSVDSGISLPNRKDAVGPRETVELDTLDRDRVEEYVLAFIKEILDPRDTRQRARGEWSR